MYFSTIAISFGAFVAMVSTVNAQTRSPQGFIFDCDSVSCPNGPYQNLCPQCDNLEYGNGASVIQCACFDSTNTLQAFSTIRDSQTCASISADSTGTLVCDQSGSLRGKKKKHGNNVEDVVESEGTPAPGPSDTAAPTPHFLQTASPTVGSGPVHVDFTFSCVGGTCPSGQYQEFCPRCVIDTDSTPPNDSADSMTCQCFNANGQMLLRESVMWNYESCPKIVADFGGQLGCVGAGKNSGVHVYGRLLNSVH